MSSHVIPSLLPQAFPSPGGFMPDLKYRYLAEDVPTGLCFTRGLAELLEVPTPTIDKAYRVPGFEGISWKMKKNIQSV